MMTKKMKKEYFTQNSHFQRQGWFYCFEENEEYLPKETGTIHTWHLKQALVQTRKREFGLLVAWLEGMLCLPTQPY